MKKIHLAVLLILALVGLLIVGLWWAMQPVAKVNEEPKTFVVARGESVQAIGEKLAAADLIRHPLLFRLQVRLLAPSWSKTNTSLQAGSFKLSPSMSLDEIIYALTQGTEDVWLTFLEGWRTEEIAEYAQKNLDDFDAAVFVELAQADEGQLFPDSYLVPREYSESQLHSLLKNTFQKKVVQSLDSQISASKLDLRQILTLASLVEREARGSEQMRRVAGILLNRLDLGMALQVDATLQYAKSEGADGDWWTTPLAADKNIESPYNTYLNAGLPPGPICNPGLTAISAVLDPIASDDLYYLHAPDGKIYYAQDLAGHNQNISKYLR